MIPFHFPQLSDRGWISEILHAQHDRGCERNFTTMFVWSHRFRQEVARIGGMVVLRSFRRRKCAEYLFPMGDGDWRPVVEQLRAEAEAKGLPCRFRCVTRDVLLELEKIYPGGFDIETARGGFDYLYEIDRLADLSGKKLHAKRNHIHRFEQAHPGWTFEPITAETLPECRAMEAQWLEEVRASASDAGHAFWETLEDESHALHLALDHYEDLGLEGGLIRAEGRTVAFTIGDRIGRDTYDIHFEKAFSDLQGAYAIINREFARDLRARHPDVRYLNREEDMDIEGLRRAKLSYYPDLLLEKSSVTFPAPEGGQ